MKLRKGFIIICFLQFSLNNFLAFFFFFFFKSGSSVLTRADLYLSGPFSFFYPRTAPWAVTAAMKLNDTYFLEAKLGPN